MHFLSPKNLFVGPVLGLTACLGFAAGPALAQSQPSLIAAGGFNGNVFDQTFTGYGTTTDGFYSGYSEQFSGSGNTADLTLTDQPVLNYEPVILADAQPAISAALTPFTGTDVISDVYDAQNNVTADLTGTYNAAAETFSGTADFTNGQGIFAPAFGTDQFTLALTPGPIPEGVFQPNTPGTYSYVATFTPNAAAVPEPSSLALLGLGLLPLAWAAKKRRMA